MIKNEQGRIKYKFSTKFLLGIITLAIVPIIIFSLFTQFFTLGLVKEYIKKQTSSSLTTVVTNFDHIIGGYKSALSVLKEDEQLIEILINDAPKKDVENTLFQKMYLIMGDRANEISMFIVKADNSYRVGSAPFPSRYDPTTYSNWGIFGRLKKEEAPGVFPNVYVNTLKQKIVITLAVSIKHEGEVVGYAIIDIPEKVLTTSLNTSSDFYDSLSYVVADQKGLVLFNNTGNATLLNFLTGDFAEMIKTEGTGEDYYEENDSSYLITVKNSPNFPIVFLSMQNVDFLGDITAYIYQVIVAVTICSALLCLVAGYFFSKSMLRPIKQIVDTIEEIEKGNLDLSINLKNQDEFGFVATKFDEALQSIRFYYKRDMEQRDRMRLAELQSLQAQMDPHFLYNTLDSIKWLAKLNNVPEISNMVTELGQLLKSSMSNEQTETTLAESLELVRCYIKIQLVRYENRFDYEIHMEPALGDYIMPKLLIQPLVENAIVHGIEESLNKVFLEIKAYEDGDRIYIVVSDDGVGMDTKAVSSKGNDIALKNIDKRIRLYYGENYGIKVESEKGKGTKVTMELPPILNTNL